MRTKITPVILSAFLLSFAVFSFTSAQNGRGEAGDESNTRGNATNIEERDQDDSVTAPRNTASTEEREDNASTTENDRNNLMSEVHRSAVATFVQSLLSVADREGGIGAEVREIAKAQNDSASTTATALVKVEGRGPIRTFLFGSDYKNLGVVRSELATTTNNVARLKKVLERTTNEADRAELNTQIRALETEQAKVNAFVTSKESKFSLFGWFVKWFAR